MRNTFSPVTKNSVKHKIFAGLGLFVILFTLSTCQSDKRNFKGITDMQVLPLLKHLPYRYGGMNIPAKDGRFLYDLIMEHHYKRGLEIGTSNGYSTLWLGLAFKQTGGKVITIEINVNRGREAEKNFKKAGLDKVIDSRINDALAEIPQLKGDFDFVFIDAWEPDYIKYFNMLKDRIVPGGVITAHNVIGFSDSMQDFLIAIKSDKNFDTSVNHASREGISVSYRK